MLRPPPPQILRLRFLPWKCWTKQLQEVPSRQARQARKGPAHTTFDYQILPWRPLRSLRETQSYLVFFIPKLQIRLVSTFPDVEAAIRQYP
jgi:hypothetical protein